MSLTKIGWCYTPNPKTGELEQGYVFNPWRGCVRWSPACENCYAETMQVGRFHLPIWGAKAERMFAADSAWANLGRWNRRAQKLGFRLSVFSASQSDLFESYAGDYKIADQMEASRQRLWKTIEETPWLRYLLLTKRPENINHMIPARWMMNGCPPNVYMGTTVENDKYATPRLNALLSIPARVHWVSNEPALGPINWEPWLVECGAPFKPKVDLIITGGESGHNARGFDLEIARSTQRQCREFKTSFYCKQMGERPFDGYDTSGALPVPRWLKVSGKGEALSEMPADLQSREFPPAWLEIPA